MYGSVPLLNNFIVIIMNVYLDTLSHKLHIVYFQMRMFSWEIQMIMHKYKNKCVLKRGVLP